MLQLLGSPFANRRIKQGQMDSQIWILVDHIHALDYLERMYPQALPYLNCNISDLCCEKLKKSPLKRVAKHMQMQCSIIGTLAEESQIRKRDWITYGSNIFFQKKDNQCRPLSFWTNQDIWDYIKLCNLPVSDLYSQGYQRNGCIKHLACCLQTIDMTGLFQVL